MGKYMRKAKITGDVALMEVSQSSLGVRTRAKTLALQRLQAKTTPPPPNPESSYLELRSRRLEKKQQSTPLKDSCRQNPETNSCLNPNPGSNSRLRLSLTDSGSVGSVSIRCLKMEDGTADDYDLGIDAYFGENNLEFEGRDRSTRESTPCSLIRELDTIQTPVSSTRPTSLTRIRNSVERNIPTTHEMEEFFTRAEQQQRKLFIEKYNFDVANDLPLPGRFEWVSLCP